MRRIDIKLSLNVWENSPVKPYSPGLLFSGYFLITVWISVLVTGLLRFPVFSWFSLGRLYDSKNVFISSRLSNFSYKPLHFSGIHFYLSSHVSDFIYHDLLFLSFVSKGLSNLLIFSKNQLLVSLFFFFFYCILVFISLVLLWFLLFPFFYLLWASFVLLFLVHLGGRLHC